jgi:hypothetical protein
VIEAYVRRMDWVMSPELRTHIPGLRGDIELSFEAVNGVLWAGMSQAFADALELLRSQGRVHVHGTSPLVYLIDGGMLRLPVAKRPPKGGYKQPHWVPVCLRTVPLE